MNILKKVILTIIFLLALLSAGIFIYVRISTYKPMTEALDLISLAQKKGNLYLFEPETYHANFIFYPGGFVDERAYAPLLKSLSDSGVRVFLVDMPLGLAITNINAASSIIENYQSDLPWYIGGHSLGGASASLWAKDHHSKILGIVFLGAYPANSADLSETNLKILSIYGTLDLILNHETYLETQALLPNDTLYVAIEGGNHAYFGHYGEQKGDGSATITRVEQQNITLDLIITWMFET